MFCLRHAQINITQKSAFSGQNVGKQRKEISDPKTTTKSA
jgi:hypothetical protein